MMRTIETKHLWMAAVVIAGAAFLLFSGGRLQSEEIIAKLRSLPASSVTQDHLGHVTVITSHYDRFDDAALMSLNRFHDLELLSLFDSSVSDRGVCALQPLRQLKWVSLDGSKITDASVACLSRLPALETLTLCNTAVSDASIPVLSQCKHLRFLDMRKTQITKSGIARLKQAAPKCDIDADP